MTMIILLQALLLISGTFFFLVGTVGILRFPDVYTRLHALTKADNLGLGLIMLGLLLSSASLPAALKLILIWLLALTAAATGSHLVARRARQQGIQPITKTPHTASDQERPYD